MLWKTVQTLAPLNQWPTVVWDNRIKCFQLTKWKSILRLRKLRRRVLLPRQQPPKVQLKLLRRRRLIAKSSVNPLISILSLTNTLMRSSNQCRCLKIRLIPFYLSQKPSKHPNHLPPNSKVKLPKFYHTPKKKMPRFRLKKESLILRVMHKLTVKHGP